MLQLCDSRLHLFFIYSPNSVIRTAAVWLASRYSVSGNQLPACLQQGPSVVTTLDIIVSEHIQLLISFLPFKISFQLYLASQHDHQKRNSRKLT